MDGEIDAEDGEAFVGGLDPLLDRGMGRGERAEHLPIAHHALGVVADSLRPHRSAVAQSLDRGDP